MKRIVYITILAGLWLRGHAQTLYLSGTGSDHTVNWDFLCTGGQNAGKWTTIPVPGNWELQGFGAYNYGLDKDTLKAREQGLYRYRFIVPEDWNGKTVKIVFEGSMTDTRVSINGRVAGPIHQGAFYRFSYDITPLLRYGRQNLLEVTVSKVSANRSVNQAERHGDFWVFGGIYRPVYLQAFPVQHIDHVAIDAGGDGALRAELRLAGLRLAGPGGREGATGAPGADSVRAQVFTLDGRPVGGSFTARVTNDTLVRLQTVVPGILPWSPEAPQLYQLRCTLLGHGQTLHVTERRFGFRTIELRPEDGIYVNGVKIKFKGICRHSFWPTTGRATSKALSIEDVELMKEMNMNAVRMSHYPPDDHFLDVCDSLGLFVLDELTGWHHAYDTEVGSRLVREMIDRDVNHPSVVLWDNGNEGGFNFDLDPLFDRLDIQHRPLIHPWAVFRHTDTQHYINYDYGSGTGLHGHDVTFPTEFLHALYDGGGGAGLQDYWEWMWNDPLSAGGFIWDFSDEAVVRTDRNGELDTDGDHAPDGVLGPYREKEGSFYAIKAVWTPVVMGRKEVTPSFDGRLTVENRYFYTNLNRCSYRWTLKRLGGPWAVPAAQGPSTAPAAAPPAGAADSLSGVAPAPPTGAADSLSGVAPAPPTGAAADSLSGVVPAPPAGAATDSLSGVAAAPDVRPGDKGVLDLGLPANWNQYDVLYLTIRDAFGRELYTWSWPLRLPEAIAERVASMPVGAPQAAARQAAAPQAVARQAASPVATQANAATAATNAAVRLATTDTTYEVTTGPLHLTFNRASARLTGVRNAQGTIPFGQGPLLCDTTDVGFKGMDTHYTGDSLVLEATFEKKSDCQTLRWTVCPSGWVKLDVAYFPEAYTTDYMGISFSYPEAKVKGVRWMGEGPYRVWKNRMKGTTLGLWDKAYNNTVTGQGNPVYPEFKGYYANLYWVRLLTDGQPVTIVCASRDVFLRLYTPAWPAHAYNTAPPFPVGDISFMHAIPPIGTKSQKAENMGPSGHQNMYYDYGKSPAYAKRVTLFFNFSGE
ncbi:glycoside hydrolase family 2 protein [Dinghuibacter silviterrae]|uniref:beta-galactosidase n=1 Tax=Dinghuibacter silviterrae TaxID=1539049 RepID=A0A4R8DVE7_9BACT|nr:glycoside hydrolase family 2 TIM barrel-domain containing protein [Dinghuibacter silviterrae]TDX01387.1 beta galactosidase small subunit [Dinghuibacter silviterrae]